MLLTVKYLLESLLRRVLPLLVLFIIPLFAVEQESADGAPTVAFKKYLSIPPCISRLVYSELSPGIPPRKFVLGLYKDDFYYRQIKNGENYVDAISTTNMMRGGFFVGRAGDLRWQINGFGVGKSFPNPEKPDAYTIFSETSKTIINGILNLGPQMIVPGSFSWKDNNFEAKPSSIALQFKPDLRVFEGTIRTKGGYVVGMDCPMCGSFRYEYDEKSTLPKGFPSRILSMRDGKEWKAVVQFHEVQFADPSFVDLQQFTPEYHIRPEVTLLTVISNNQKITEPMLKSPSVVKLINLEIAAKKTSVKSWRPTIVAAVFAAVVFAPALYWFGKYRRHKSAVMDCP